MLTLKQRIQAIDDGLTLDGDYQEELTALNVIEQEIPTYRYLGTPAWKAEEAKQEITRIRKWINEELAGGE